MVFFTTCFACMVRGLHGALLWRASEMALLVASLPRLVKVYVLCVPLLGYLRVLTKFRSCVLCEPFTDVVSSQMFTLTSRIACPPWRVHLGPGAAWIHILLSLFQ